MVADIVTDLAGIFEWIHQVARMLIWEIVITIPILILRKVQIKPKTKLFLGTSLCLSFAMVIVTIVRVSGLRNGVNLDPVWDFYWQVVESSIAIIMVSSTAFRSFFVQERIRRSQEKRSWYHGMKQMLSSRSGGTSEESAHELPPIARGHLTGLRTMIHRNGRTSQGAGTYLQDEDDDAEWGRPVAQGPIPRNMISVRQEIMVHSEPVHLTLSLWLYDFANQI